MTKSKVLAFGLLALMITGLLLVAGCIPPTTGGAGAPPAGSAPANTGFDWTTIAFIAVIIVVFYFLMIRPQSNRRKQQQKLMSELKVGDQVITTSGIYGQIDSMDEETIVLKIEAGAKIRISRQTVAGKR